MSEPSFSDNEHHFSSDEESLGLSEQKPRKEIAMVDNVEDLSSMNSQSEYVAETLSIHLAAALVLLRQHEWDQQYLSDAVFHNGGIQSEKESGVYQ